jgi:SET domain-containing protein
MFYRILFFSIFFGSNINTQDNLKKDCMKCTEFSFVLKQSSQGNIGLFAAHDIAQGTLILDKPFELRVMQTKDIPKDFLQFSIPINSIESACPEHFDRMEIAWYMNHSSNPNIEKRIDVAYENVIDLLKALTFYAIKDIKAGDEILIDLHKVQQKFPS